MSLLLSRVPSPVRNCPEPHFNCIRQLEKSATLFANTNRLLTAGLVLPVNKLLRANIVLYSYDYLVLFLPVNNRL